MKGRERNSAFFQGKEVETSGSSGLSRLFKTARETGKINLSGRSLTEIPDTVFMLASTLEEGDKFWEVNPLSRLDVASNLLKNIPDGKFDLIKTDLTYLKMKDNKLQSLPEDLFACAQLKYLDLSVNDLKTISYSIGELIELKELILTENKLTSLPISLSFCKSLQILALQSNVLSRIPLASLSLPQLLNLNLSSNRLAEIPTSISAMTNLGEPYLSV